jgi:hypothetical protein
MLSWVLRLVQPVALEDIHGPQERANRIWSFRPPLRFASQTTSPPIDGGEESRRYDGLAPFLYPTKWGRGGEPKARRSGGTCSRSHIRSPSPLWGRVGGGGAVRFLLSALIFLALPESTYAAQNKDPSWPCIQRKVPELSFGQIWNGPELPAIAKDWSKDERISDLVEEVAARRVPLADAQKQIREFAAALPADRANDQLAMLVRGLFDYMNGERSQVISGIGRYAHNQLELAARLRKEASEVDSLRNKPDADANEIALRTDRLTWETRVFEERVQSLTYVCEVPTLIEQRLYALAKTVSEVMKGRE